MTSQDSQHTSSSRPGPGPDTATLLMISTCYLRLLQVYSSIINDIRSAIISTNTPEGRAQLSEQCNSRCTHQLACDVSSSPNLCLPDVKIGSFSAPQSGTLHFFLLIQLLEYQLDQLEKALHLTFRGNPCGRAINATITEDVLCTRKGHLEDLQCAKLVLEEIRVKIQNVRIKARELNQFLTASSTLEQAIHLPFKGLDFSRQLG